MPLASMKSSYAQKIGRDTVRTGDENLGMLEEKKGKRQLEAEEEKRNLE